jgi:nucleoside-diphosphate-sugar epimerase
MTINKKALVLGSSGLIGRSLVKTLRDNSFDVSEFDIQIDNQDYDLTAPKKSRANQILNYEISKTDVVFFLAFDVGGSKYLGKYENTFEFISNNIQMMDNVFELVKKYNKKVIFASSMMTKIPFSTYGILKTIGERYTESVHGVSVRFWNVYGVEHKTLNEIIYESEKNHVITDFIISGLTKGEIETQTTGKEIRQFIHVSDAATALLMIFENYKAVRKDLKNKNEKAVDVSNGYWIEIAEIAKIVSGFLNVPVKLGVEIDRVQKNSKIEPDLDIINGISWKYKTDIFSGISSIVSHYKNLLNKK